MATLKNVSEKTSYSYIYCKMVNCGLKDNIKILKAICEEKKLEIENIERIIYNVEKLKEKKQLEKLKKKQAKK